MKRVFIPCILCTVLSLTASLRAGSYSFDFLDLGIGTRARALGGSFVSMADDGSALLWNPAGSSSANSSRFYFSHNANFSGMSTIDYISFIKPIIGSSSFSVAFIRHAVDDIPVFPELEGTPQERDTTPELQGNGIPLGYFGETAHIYFVNIAKMVTLHGNRLSIGGNFKYFDESLYGASATGIGLDIGTILAFKMMIPGMFGIGICMQDISDTRIVWNTQSETKDAIPMNYRMGLHYRIPISAIQSSFSIGFDRNTRYEGSNHVGMEYSYRDHFVVDMGWNQSKWSFGTGCKFWKIGVQYGFITHTLGSSHAMSMEFIL
jgi:hypothetical protein